MSELLARVEVLSRRSGVKPSAVLQVGELALDLPMRRVTSGGVEIDLTPTEFSILELLMRHAGQVVTRKMLCESLWESDWEGTTNVIEVHINRLRSKLQRGTKEPLIHTVRGRGYALAPRLREIFSTLRFRLVLWITLVVFMMVVITNIAVREVEQRASCTATISFSSTPPRTSTLPWADSRRGIRSCYLSSCATRCRRTRIAAGSCSFSTSRRNRSGPARTGPDLPPPSFSGESNGPFDEKKYRVYEKKLFKPSGQVYFIRCGFLQVELQEDIAVLNRTILVASISILLAAPLGAYVIALRATRPIIEITTTTAHLQPSNLNDAW